MIGSPRITALGGAALASVFLLGGCSMAPHYTRPQAPVPSQVGGTTLHGKPLQASDITIAGWQSFFTDERLKKTIEQALQTNRDLQVASAAIERARALYRIQRADQLPRLNATASESAQRIPADLSGNGQARVAQQYAVGLGISSFELDIFGRVNSLKGQALETYLATAEAQRSIRLSLIAEVANAWLNLAADRERLALAKATLHNQEAYHRLIQQRVAGGIAAMVEELSARTGVDSARVDVARFTGQIQQSMQTLQLLVGSSLRDELLPERLTAVTTMQQLPSGISSTVLLRRPDIQAAEHRLKAANASIGAARAAYFPRIGLSASLGTASADLSGLFKGGSGVWSFTPQISVPLFDYGAVKAGVAVSKADRTIAVAQYEKAIQVAFREVSDVMTLQTTMQDQVVAQQSLTDAANESYRISQQRYELGVDSYLAVLVAQRYSYTAQQTLVSTRLNQYAIHATVYKALGGSLNP